MTFLRTFLIFIFLLTNNNAYTFSQENLTKDSNQSMDLNVLKCVLMPSTMSCRFFRKSDVELCESIKGFDRGVETFDNYSGSLKEAKRRGLNCRVNDEEKPSIASNQIRNSSKRPLASELDSFVCSNATTVLNGSKVWDDRNKNFVAEANYRGLDCGVKNSSKTIVTGNDDINGSIWTFYEDDGDVRLYLFRKDNTFKVKNVKSYYHMGKVFGDDDERWSITDNVVLISHNDGYNKIYLNINETRDEMKGVARNKKGKVQRVIGKLENKDVIFKNGNFSKYKKPSQEKIAEYVAKTKNIRLKYTDIAKIKMPPNTLSNIKTNKKNIINNKELEKEKQKIINLQRKADAKELRLIEEKNKRKALEKEIAKLKREKKELQQTKKIKQKSSNEIGSGFYVSKFRHIVTNQHVINQCKEITVGDSMSSQIPAKLIASDRRNDLAILQTISMESASGETRSLLQKLSIEVLPPLAAGGLIRSEDVVGGEEIFVAGYPLGNMVSDQMKLTDGIVSATKGLDNDVSQFEITSVVRKGNSGGPIYDNKGNIVGVVVERFNVNSSDNVNFAIKGSTVKQFLSTHNVSTKWSNRQDNISTKDIYKIASKQTVMVVCRHN